MKQPMDDETNSEGQLRRPPTSRQLNSSAYHKLAEACKRHELPEIKAILGERPELVNQRDRRNRSLLHYASILLRNEMGATSETQTDEDGRRSVECFDHLTNRCDLKLWWQQDLDGLSTLHLAVISGNVELARHLILCHPYSAKYPLVCTLDNELHSPLHWAVITNNLACVRLLIDCAGARLALEPDLNGASPLHYATQTGECPRYRQQLHLMLKNVSSTSSGSTGVQSSDDSPQKRSKLARQQRSIKEGSQVGSMDSGDLASNQVGLEILDYLASLPDINLECQDKDRRTPLLWAASSGNREAVALLAKRGANLASADSARLSALHCAASHGFTDCLECLLYFAQRQSSTGGSLQVNQVDNLSCTPLFYAVLSGNIDCVESLLERGADQNWQDLKGRTAAHFAALKGQLNSLKLLLARGANLWLPNKQGDLPLHYAIKSGRQHVVRWLLEHSPYERAVNAINNFGRAPIHLAALKGNCALADYLIRCGANLDQLVKVRHPNGKTASYSYETALDMAQRLDHQDCLTLLQAQKARSASEVIRQRAIGRPNAALFGLQSAEGASPIGFETSSSSASYSNAHELKRAVNREQAGRVPHMSPPPAPDALPHSDSTASSALSQNSLTSLRGGHKVDRESAKRDEDSPSGDPYNGGISYSNDLMKASIKCKLYGSHRRSFPAGESPERKPQDRSAQSAPIGGQEIITNVSVLTQLPCPRCIREPATEWARQQKQCNQCRPARPRRRRSADGLSQRAWPEDSDSDTESENRRWTPPDRLPSVSLPETTRRGQSLRYLPPSQSHEQHLPAIFSDDQGRSASATSNEQSMEPADQPQEGQQQKRSQSRADEEPRFDWTDRGNSRHRTSRYQVRSPVADYIHSGEPLLKHQQGRSVSLNRVAGESGYFSHGTPDLSQVRAKVDSRRPNEPARSSTSMSMLSQASSRSPSRQMAAIRSRVSAEGEEELALAIERSIRKYKQETKLFEELQNLKRSQIRSGRANEALLVKRLVERFRQDHTMLDLIGFESYKGPYTYKSYELYLYDQLRKLSQSNCAKLRQIVPNDPPPASTASDQPAVDEHPDYLDEDLRADQELRRVMMGADDDESVVVEPSEALEQIPTKSELQETQTALESDNERTTTEQQQENSMEGDHEQQERRPLEDQLTSSILVDALGNVSRAGSVSGESESASKRRVSFGSIDGDQKPTNLTSNRRKSVVTIGNKVELIYHDVGIEIESPEESPAHSVDRESDAASDDANEASVKLPEEPQAAESDSLEQQAEDDVSQLDETVEPQPLKNEDPTDKIEMSRAADLQVKPSFKNIEQGQLRRGSSPPAASLAQIRPDIPHQRRANSMDQSSGKKVFNGNDLDEMRRSLRRTPVVMEESNVATGGRTEVDTRREGRRASEIGGFIKESATVEVKEPRASDRRRLMVRSRIPSGEFHPQVDLETVQRRWARFKTAGREQRRLKRGSEVGPLFGSSLETSGLGRAGAKSQPSLNDAYLDGEQQNYVLLYEINKSLISTAAPTGPEPATRARQQVNGWCYRRMVRIVDVRALKRTLSLPESLIYSNDLLKRFNILKL